MCNKIVIEITIFDVKIKIQLLVIAFLGVYIVIKSLKESQNLKKLSKETIFLTISTLTFAYTFIIYLVYVLVSN